MGLKNRRVRNNMVEDRGDKAEVEVGGSQGIGKSQPTRDKES
jgi:hypothetical protein